MRDTKRENHNARLYTPMQDLNHVKVGLETHYKTWKLNGKVIMTDSKIWNH